MPPSPRRLCQVRLFLAVSLLLIGVCLPAAAQGSKDSAGSRGRFDTFLQAASDERDVSKTALEAQYQEISEAIPTMTAVEVSAGVAAIDKELAPQIAPQPLRTRFYAVLSLTLIGWRPDGYSFLIPELDRLRALLVGPEVGMQSLAVMPLSIVGYKRPELVTPIFEAALEAPNTMTVAPGVATILLRMARPSDDVVHAVVQFMRRPDLTVNARIDTVIGITNSPVIPDAVAAELIRYLGIADDPLRRRVLVALSRSSPEAFALARPHLQTIANDPNETDDTKRVAREALQGQVVSSPETNK